MRDRTGNKLKEFGKLFTSLQGYVDGKLLHKTFLQRKNPALIYKPFYAFTMPAFLPGCVAPFL